MRMEIKCHVRLIFIEEKMMNNNLDVNKISAEVITDLAKTTAQTLYQ